MKAKRKMVLFWGYWDARKYVELLVVWEAIYKSLKEMGAASWFCNVVKRVLKPKYMKTVKKKIVGY